MSKVRHRASAPPPHHARTRCGGWRERVPSSPLATKPQVEVNGKDADPLFTFLKQSKGELLGDSIKWNFRCGSVKGVGSRQARRTVVLLLAPCARLRLRASAASRPQTTSAPRPQQVPAGPARQGRTPLLAHDVPGGHRRRH